MQIKFLNRSLYGAVFLAAFVLFSPLARANITILPTFNASILNDPNSASIQQGINNAIAQIQSYILNPITVSIEFTNMASGLGQSSTSFVDFSYSQYRTDLATKQTLSANDIAANATLPATPTNPVNGNSNMTLTLPVLRALGESAGNNAGLDSTISLNLSQMNYLRTGLQDPNKFDLIQVALHEIVEVLSAGGGGSALDVAGPAVPTGPVGSLDLFRYSGLGVRSFTTSAQAVSYFSFDGGATNRSFFNQNGSGDYGDWGPGQNPQVQDAFGSPGLQLNLSNNELAALDVIGYDLVLVPEPGTIALLSVGLVALAGRVCARRRTVEAPSSPGFIG